MPGCHPVIRGEAIENVNQQYRDIEKTQCHSVAFSNCGFHHKQRAVIERDRCRGEPNRATTRLEEKVGGSGEGADAAYAFFCYQRSVHRS